MSKAEVEARHVTATAEETRYREPHSTTHGERFELRRLCSCDRCEGFGKLYAGGIPGHKSEKWERCRECRGEGRVLSLVASCATPEAVGVALVTLAQEGEFEGCQFGLLDTEGEVGEKWLVRPWNASAREISQAGRVLQAARKERT